MIRRLFIALAPKFMHEWVKRNRVKLLQIKIALCHPAERIIKPIVKALLPHRLLRKIRQYRANRKAAPLLRIREAAGSTGEIPDQCCPREPFA